MIVALSHFLPSASPPFRRQNNLGIWLQMSALALFCMLLVEQNAQAAGFDYRVKIDAPDTLKTLLEKNLDIVRWRGNERIDADQLQRLYRGAPDQIRKLIATEGYYSAQVDARLDKTDGVSAVYFHLDPGPPALVDKVDIELKGFGNDPADIERTQTLRHGWMLGSGQVFRQADWEIAKAALLRQATLTRTPKAQYAVTEAVVDPAKNQVALTVVLDAGQAMTFGAVHIEGLQRYPASVVNNLNTIKPGNEYNQALLMDLQSRLQDTGYFSGVEVSADIDTASGSAPVTVKLTENKMKKVSIGIGYSTNTGNRAQVSYDDLSLLGLKLKSNITLETKKQAANAELFWPVTARGYSDSAAIQYERRDISGEVTNISSIGVKRAWGVPALERSLALEYLTERKSVAGLEKSRSQSLPLTYSVTFRRTDSVMFPTTGYILNAQIGGAPLPLLTDRIFLRGSTKLSSYHAIGKKDLLILRGEIGAVVAKDKSGIPDTYLFRAGGDQSVRGYGYQELGVPSGDAIVGGRYLAAGGVEYQRWFLPAWGGAVFYDAGNAADSIPALRPKSGYGVGVRWKSPVGPVNMDVAYGHATKEYRLHFSLGFTF